MPELTKPSIPVHRLRAMIAGSSLSIGLIFDEIVELKSDEVTKEELIDHKVKFDAALLALDAALEGLSTCKS